LRFAAEILAPWLRLKPGVKVKVTGTAPLGSLLRGNRMNTVRGQKKKKRKKIIKRNHFTSSDKRQENEDARADVTKGNEIHLQLLSL